MNTSLEDAQADGVVAVNGSSRTTSHGIAYKILQSASNDFGDVNDYSRTLD